jgi:cation diffusion facilitator CzcD-associated flavoprotein CzcO
MDHDAIIVGAGMSGLYQLYRLRELGLRAKIFEAGTGVGGTWYWNRYPGARFDSESYSYGYSFSKELLGEWNWSEHFAPQPETLRYLNHGADRFDLRGDIQFNSHVSAATWHEGDCCWEIRLQDGTRHTGRFLITCIGALSAPTLPRIKGIDSFQGLSFHTANWPRQPVSFSGKRIAVIGTGATGVQTIQEVAKSAAHLTVFQRTPNWCAPLHNSTIGEDEQATIKQSYAEIFARCRQSFAGFLHSADPRRTFDVPAEEREAFWEKLYAERGFGIWVGNFSDMLTDAEANKAMSDFVARKIRERVRHPRVAEKLIPKNHGFGTRRVPLETKYYEVYNQPNVELIDLVETPIEHISPSGIRTTDRDFPLDMIIFATGFDALTGAFNQIEFEGVGGVTLRRKWVSEGAQTFLGMLNEGFPNMFMVLGPYCALGNIPRSIEYNVEWVTGLIRHMHDNGLARAMARPNSAAGWMQTVQETAKGLLANEVDSWFTGINTNVEGKQTRMIARYSGSAPDYRKRCEEEAARGYPDLAFAQN